MLSNIQMGEQFVEVFKQGSMDNLSPNFECDSECDDCPARQACKQLSYDSEAQTSSYKLFIANYKGMMLHPTVAKLFKEAEDGL